MGKIVKKHSNMEVVVDIRELLEMGFPQEYVLINLTDPVPELLGGTMEELITFRKAFNSVAARLVREKSKQHKDKHPTMANISVNGSEIRIVLGGWKKRPGLK